MTSSIRETAKEPPDPAIPAGIALLGIFVMGVGGASDAHYAFNAGVGLATLGAAVFVLFVALTALRQRRARLEGGDGDGGAAKPPHLPRAETRGNPSAGA